MLDEDTSIRPRGTRESGVDVRIAVIGGTGLAGGHVVDSLGRSGHEAVVIARSRGVDLATGEGLDEALAGAEAVIDVSNAPAPEDLGTMTERLLAAEEGASVAHHVLLSIVGVHRVGGNPHYAGKRRQEELVQAGRVPWTIVHATPFHEFAIQIVGSTLRDGTATVPPLLLQPVAAADVGDALAEVAAGEPRHGTLELAGPETQDLVDMARRAMAARGTPLKIVASWRDGPFTTEMAGEVMLPGSRARLAPTTFEEWLEKAF
jgi:uncharacterized protein YbjT (DUF2867 family)